MITLTSRSAAAIVGGAVLLAGIAFGVALQGTHATLDDAARRVEAAAARGTPPTLSAETLASLPPPVARYFKFAFPRGVPPHRLARVEMEGEFHRPGVPTWEPTTVSQVAAVASPDFVFSGLTGMGWGLWARMMDAYTDGRMEMSAWLLSTVRVLDKSGDADLSAKSAMRHALEAPTFPAALLPGKHLSWEPIDDSRARLSVRAGDYRGAYVVTFRPDGSIATYDAEGGPLVDGPIHGPGEHAERSDYKEVNGMMIPMSFMIARKFGDRIEPFWRGRVTGVDFENPSAK